MSRRKLLVLCGAMVLVVIAALVYGYRHKLHQAELAFKYNRQMNEAKSQMRQEFGATLDGFGLTERSLKHHRCNDMEYSGYDNPQFNCSSYYENYQVVGGTEVDKAAANNRAAELENVVKTQGWTMQGSQGYSFSQWFKDVTSGTDWYPDVGAYKNYGTTHCYIHFNVAYSNPKPAAISAQMGCTAPQPSMYMDLAN